MALRSDPNSSVVAVRPDKPLSPQRGSWGKQMSMPSESVRLSLARASPRVRMLTVVATLLVQYLDIISDGVTAWLYRRAGHTWWFYFCVGFMLVGPVSLAAVRLALAAFHTCGPPRVFRWHAWALGFASLVHLDGVVAQVGVVRQSHAQGWKKSNPLEELPALSDKSDGMLLSIQDYKFLEAITEALPQVCLQGYVLLVLRLSSSLEENNGWVFLLQTTSFLLSLVSIAITVAFVRISWQSGPTQNLLCQINVLGWTMAETTLKVLGLAFFGAAFRSYLFIAIAVVFVLKLVVVLAVFRTKSWQDQAVYLGLSMFMWFHVDDDRGRVWPRRLMFAVDTLVAGLFLLLPMMQSLQPGSGDPLLAGSEVMFGVCDGFMERNGCTGFPLSYVVSYIAVAVLTQVGFWLNELGLLETGSTTVMRACPLCCSCFSWCSCCAGLPCGPAARMDGDQVVAVHINGGAATVETARAKKPRGDAPAKATPHDATTGLPGEGDADGRRGSNDSDASYRSAGSVTSHGSSRSGRLRQTYTKEEHRRHRRTHRHLKKHLRAVALTEAEPEAAPESDRAGKVARTRSGRLKEDQDQLSTLPSNMRHLMHSVGSPKDDGSRRQVEAAEKQQAPSHRHGGGARRQVHESPESSVSGDSGSAMPGVVPTPARRRSVVRGAGEPSERHVQLSERQLANYHLFPEDDEPVRAGPAPRNSGQARRMVAPRRGVAAAPRRTSAPRVLHARVPFIESRHDPNTIGGSAPTVVTKPDVTVVVQKAPGPNSRFGGRFASAPVSGDQFHADRPPPPRRGRSREHGPGQENDRGEIDDLSSIGSRSAGNTTASLSSGAYTIEPDSTRTSPASQDGVTAVGPFSPHADSTARSFIIRVADGDSDSLASTMRSRQPGRTINGPAATFGRRSSRDASGNALSPRSDVSPGRGLIASAAPRRPSGLRHVTGTYTSGFQPKPGGPRRQPRGAAAGRPPRSRERVDWNSSLLDPTPDSSRRNSRAAVEPSPMAAANRAVASAGSRGAAQGSGARSPSLDTLMQASSTQFEVDFGTVANAGPHRHSAAQRAAARRLSGAALQPSAAAAVPGDTNGSKRPLAGESISQGTGRLPATSGLLRSGQTPRRVSTDSCDSPMGALSRLRDNGQEPRVAGGGRATAAAAPRATSPQSPDALSRLDLAVRHD